MRDSSSRAHRRLLGERTVDMAEVGELLKVA
jgi:hypothetical protein